ncbi:flagellar export protein FliJ [Salinicola aestuarinus]|uniref:flagellar export protein FliJ n=1 Tax=Salinicola aestuarinus TaxID=1949082 RepID=UPI000DA1D7F1|nr:flagellar export protein FliJ [Salinicola aestuarinus]
MANVESMEMLRDLAKRQSDKAVEDLGHLRRQHQDAEARLTQLEQYRDEYRQKLHDALSAGVSSSQWRDYQQFLASLDRAIEQQRRQLGEQQARVEGGMHRWQGEQRKFNAYDMLHTRGLHERSHRQAKDEQRQSDEMAAQLRRRQQDNGRGF